MKYFGRTIRRNIIPKLLFTLLGIFAMVTLSSQYYLSLNITIYEYILVVFSDKFFLSIFLFSNIIVWTSGAFDLSGSKSNQLMRVQSANRWYWICLMVLIIDCFILVFAICSALFLSGVWYGFSFNQEWSAAARDTVINVVDGLDFKGRAFELLTNRNDSKIALIGAATLLVFFRSTFYTFIYNLIYIVSRKPVIAIAVGLLVNTVDIYYFDLFPPSEMFYLPQQFSVLTSINGATPSSRFYIFFWSVSIVGLVIVMNLLFGLNFEKMILGDSRQKLNKK